MVKTYQAGILKEQPSLLHALGIEGLKSPVVSLVGAGGKTTLIRRAAEEYRRKRIPVIVTTTTHMMAEDHPWFLLSTSVEKMKDVLAREGMVWIGCPNKAGKMRSPSLEFLQEILALGYPVLIEADGSRRLPLKVPAAHEPVLLPETSHVVNVYGLDALGNSFENVCFRADIALKLLGKRETDLVSEEDIAKLALDSLAGRKGITSSMSYQIVLNKADTPEREAAALTICRLAEKQGHVRLTVAAEGK